MQQMDRVELRVTFVAGYGQPFCIPPVEFLRLEQRLRSLVNSGNSPIAYYSRENVQAHRDDTQAVEAILDSYGC